MKRNIAQLLFFSLVIIALSSCKSNDDIIDNNNIDEKLSPITQFVYDGMSSLYLWNTELIDKKPTASDNNPEKYFYSILNATDTKHSWSWITDDAESLRSEFAGEPKTFGYSLSFAKISSTIYAFVKYVYPNTPASDAGLKRLDFIGKVNGTDITADANGYIDKGIITTLYGDDPASLTIYKLTEQGMIEDKNINVTPGKVRTNPILYTNIYKDDDKRIGYIVYNSFISNFNNELKAVFNEFKNVGVNELILDLRYNHGGEITAAQHLASMIAPENDVRNQEVLTMLTYNKELGSNIYKLSANSVDANLNLDKVYIIATDDSYSASELITFCLREFIPVVHIGSKTGGKYTASITVHPFNNDLGFGLYPSEFYPNMKLTSATKYKLANWAMQPIVAKYTNNKGEDFISTDGLIPDIQLIEGFGYIDLWTPFGDTKDVLLGRALYEITGNEDYSPIQPITTRSSNMIGGKIRAESISMADEIRKGSVILDSIKF